MTVHQDVAVILLQLRFCKLSRFSLQAMDDRRCSLETSSTAAIIHRDVYKVFIASYCL